GKLKTALVLFLTLGIAVGTGLLASQLAANGALGVPPEGGKAPAVDTSSKPMPAVAAPERTDLHRDPLPAGASARLGTVRFRHGYELSALVFGPSDKVLFSAGSDCVIRAWEVSSGKLLARLRGHLGKINALALAPGGKILASASNDTTVRLWDPAQGKEIRQLNSHTGADVRVAFAPDGRPPDTA